MFVIIKKGWTRHFVQLQHRHALQSTDTCSQTRTNKFTHNIPPMTLQMDRFRQRIISLPTLSDPTHSTSAAPSGIVKPSCKHLVEEMSMDTLANHLQSHNTWKQLINLSIRLLCLLHHYLRTVVSTHFCSASSQLGCNTILHVYSLTMSVPFPFFDFPCCP